MRRGRRHNLAKPLPVVSGRVILLTDFVVNPQQGAGFVFEEIDAADLPEDAMYYGRNTDTGQVMYQIPKAREKHARWRITASVDPVWKFDSSYEWREKVREAKEGEGLCPKRTISTS